MIKRLVKRLRFEEKVREQLTFANGKARLNNDNKAAVALTLAAPYTTDNDAVVRSHTIHAKALTGLLGFDEWATVPAGTSLGYRLVFGPGGAAGVLWWSGVAWAPATDASLHWNDAQTVNDNLPALLPLPSKQLAVDINLRGSPAAGTPVLEAIALLGNFAIEWWDDLIYDTVVRSLRNTLRATTDVSFEIASSTSLIDLDNAYPLENDGYNITAVLSAYDLTDDPEKLNNLAAGYTPGAPREDGSTKPGQIALSSPVLANHELLVTLEHAPEIAVNTHQDYYEPARLPCVVFERIFQVRTTDGSSREHDTGGEGELYRNKAALTGVFMPSPRQFACRFDYAVFTTLGMDEARILSALESWVANHRAIRAWGIDEEIRVDWDKGSERSGKLDTDDVRTATGCMLMRGVQFWLRDAVDVALVGDFNLDLASLPPDVTEP